MAINEPRAWLLCYDIANPKRLGRVHRLLKKQAIRIQYSVYYYEGSTKQLLGLLPYIGSEIDSREDDVRAYPIPASPDIITFGAATMSPDLSVISNVSDALPDLLRLTTD